MPIDDCLQSLCNLDKGFSGYVELQRNATQGDSNEPQQACCDYDFTEFHWLVPHANNQVSLGFGVVSLRSLAMVWI